MNKFIQYLITAFIFPLCLIACSQTNDPLFIVEESASYSLVVTPFSSSLKVGTSQQFKATRIDRDGVITDVTQDVLWTLDTSSFANIDSSGIVTATAQGDVEINASLGKVSSSAALNIHDLSIQSLVVTPSKSITIVNISKQFLAEAIFSDGTKQVITNDVLWATDNNALSSINNQGVASADAQGLVNISADFQGVTSQGELAILASTPSSLNVQPAISEVPAGTSITYKALLTLSDGHILDITDQMTWQSSESSVANISNDAETIGHAITIKAGSSTIQADISIQGADYTADANLTVNTAVITNLQVSPKQVSVANGTVGQLTALAYFSDGSSYDVTTLSAWESNDESIVKVESRTATPGFAHAVGVGDVGITARYADLTDTVSVSVSSATLQRIEIQPSTEKVALGLNTRLSAIGIFSDFTKQDITKYVHWHSSNDGIAIMDSRNAGLLRTSAAGLVTINANYNAISAQAEVEVTSVAIDKLVINPANESVYNGGSIHYNAEIILTDGSHKNITSDTDWTSSAANTIDFSGDNVATAFKVGTASITASYTDTSATPPAVLTSTTSVSVTNATIEHIEISPLIHTTAKGLPVQYSSTVRLSDMTSYDVSSITSWQSSDTAIASINSNGLVFTHGTGAVIISSTIGSYKAEASLNVIDPILIDVEVYPSDITLPIGVEQYYSAVGLFSDRRVDITPLAIWDSSSPSIATITNSPGYEGLVDTINAGQTVIGATYLGNRGSTNLTVSADTLVSLSIDCNETSLFVGAITECIALGTYGSSGMVLDVTEEASWSSSDDLVASIDNTTGRDRVVTGLAEGTANIIATLDGLSDMEAITVIAQVSLTSISVTSANDEIPENGQEQFHAEGHYSNSTNRTITDEVLWTSGDESVISVSNQASEKGLATGVAEGLSTVKATLGSIVGFKLIDVIVSETELENLVINCDKGSYGAGIVDYNVGDTDQCHVTAHLTPTYSKNVTDESVITIDNEAVVSDEGFVPNVGDLQRAIEARGVGSTVMRAKYNGWNAELRLNVH